MFGFWKIWGKILDKENKEKKYEERKHEKKNLINKLFLNTTSNSY